MRVVLAVEHLPMNATLLEEDWYSIPINALRNIALHHASTEVGVDGCIALQNQTQQTLGVVWPLQAQSCIVKTCVCVCVNQVTWAACSQHSL